MEQTPAELHLPAGSQRHLFAEIVRSSAWFEFRGADQLGVQEQSFALPNNEIMTLLILPDSALQ